MTDTSPKNSLGRRIWERIGRLVHRDEEMKMGISWLFDTLKYAAITAAIQGAAFKNGGWLLLIAWLAVLVAFACHLALTVGSLRIGTGRIAPLGLAIGFSPVLVRHESGH